MKDTNKSIERVKNAVTDTMSKYIILGEKEFVIYIGMLIDVYCTTRGIDNESFVEVLADAQKGVNAKLGKVVK